MGSRRGGTRLNGVSSIRRLRKGGLGEGRAIVRNKIFMEELEANKWGVWGGALNQGGKAFGTR